MAISLFPRQKKFSVCFWGGGQRVVKVLCWGGGSVILFYYYSSWFLEKDVNWDIVLSTTSVAILAISQ